MWQLSKLSVHLCEKISIQVRDDLKEGVQKPTTQFEPEPLIALYSKNWLIFDDESGREWHMQHFLVLTPTEPEAENLS